MKLSKTWTGRLQRGRAVGVRLGAAAVVGLSILGGVTACKVFVTPDRPDVAGIAQRVSNIQDQIGAFAADFVTTWLTATGRDAASLAQFITLTEGTVALPAAPAAVITAPRVVSVIHTGSVGEADLFAAIVAVTERPYASAAPTRAFYQVPVSMWHYQPRAVAMPARINGPGTGADVTLGYRQALDPASPLFAVVTGFLRTYLTTTDGLDRYVVAGAPLAAVGGYSSAVVSAVSADSALPDQPDPETSIHVLASVLAQTSQFANVNLVYPLTVENSGGTWMVSAIDSIPQVGESEPDPLDKPNP